jgi:hypothetical protein
VYPKSAAKSIHYNLKGLDDLETLQWVGGWVWVFESLQTDVQRLVGGIWDKASRSLGV